MAAYYNEIDPFAEWDDCAGHGNALYAPVATEFIKAYLEAA